MAASRKGNPPPGATRLWDRGRRPLLIRPNSHGGGRKGRPGTVAIPEMAAKQERPGELVSF
jgi:hypothetical protein